MKLCEMTTRQMAETLCALTPPVCKIMQCPAVAQAMEAFCECEEEHAPLASTLGKAFEKLVPVLLTELLPEVCQVMAVMTGKDAEVIMAQPGVETMREMKQLWDGELMDFFACAGSAAPKKC